MSKLAWYVDDGDEAADIVFAETEEQAIALGVSCLWSEEEYVTARREPGFDEFAELGYVPAKAWIETGGWLECSECNRRVDEECWDYDEDVAIKPVYKGSHVFCSQGCHDSYQENREIKRIRERQAKAVLLSMFPGIYSLSVWNGGGRNYGTYAEFKAPGCKYKINWRSDTPSSVWVSRADQSAWQEFQEAIAFLFS